MFESGKWRDEDESDSEDDDDAWNLQKLREETEVIRSKNEEERLVASYATPNNGTTGEATPAEDTPTETPAETASGS
jgi:hypothetical protein